MSRPAFEESTIRPNASSAPSIHGVSRLSGEMLGKNGRGRLDLVPERLAQAPGRGGIRSIAVGLVASVLVQFGFGALFLLLLDWRDLTPATENVTPVEIVAALPPLPPKPKRAAEPAAPADTPKPEASDTSAPSAQTQAPSVVAPPPEAAPAATQPIQDHPPNTAADQQKPDRPAPPPVRAPPVLSANDGAFPVPAPAPANPNPMPLASQTAPKPDPLPSLASALPMAVSGLPPTFRAILSGAGSQASEEYKGLVFGKLGRSHRTVDQARARHLHGNVVVSFGVDQEGHLTDLRVAVSSGTPALDALALDMVREAEPFPPPPSGGRQLYTPALSFGTE